MRNIVKRIFELRLPAKPSAFLWGPRKVGKSYWITHNLGKANAVILPGVTVGCNAVFGAGSIVTKDIPDRVVAAGNPACVIREIS